MQSHSLSFRQVQARALAMAVKAVATVGTLLIADVKAAHQSCNLAVGLWMKVEG